MKGNIIRQMNYLKYITLGVFLMLMQMLISGYVNIWPMLYIAVFPMLLIALPYNINRYIALLVAFGTGLLIDFVSDGVLGLNAAAATALMYFRGPFFHLIINKNTLENMTLLTERSIGTSKFILLSAFSYAVFFIFYIALDSGESTSFLYILLRFAINLTVNVALVVLLWKTLLAQLFRQ